MLEYLRQRSRSGIIYLFFGIIIAVFIINFGPQSKGCERSNVVLAAKVNGNEIDTVDLQMEYIRHFGSTVGRDLDDEGFLQQRREALQTIMNFALLAGEAEREGLVVTREELAAYLKDPERNPDYRMLEVDGKFDVEQYRRLVTGFLQSTLERYERIRGWELQARKLVEAHRALLTVTDEEIAAAFAEKETKVNLEFVALRASEQNVSEVIGDEELQAFSAAQAEQIKEYYEKHKRDYEQPRQVHLRRIFIASGEADGAELRAAQRAKAETLRSQIAGGADMAELARTESQDLTSKEQGGDMGWISEGANPEIDAAAFALAANELSKVVEGATGFNILRAEELRPAAARSLEEATPEIARSLLLEQRRDTAAKATADALLAAAREKASLAEAVAAVLPTAPAADGTAADPALTVQETGLFSQEGRAGNLDMSSGFSFSRPWDQIPRIGRSRDISLAAFGLSAAAPVAERAFELNGSYYVIRLKDRKDAAAEIPAERKAQLQGELLAKKERSLMGDWERVLFFPTSRRMFGPAPTLGPWMQGLVDRLNAQASIYRNDDLLSHIAGREAPAEEKEAAPAEPAAPAPAPATEG